MDSKTTLLILICPVLTACRGSSDAPAPPVTAEGSDNGPGFALSAPAFSVRSPDPVRVPLLLSGSSPMDVLTAAGSGSVEEGDTLFLLSDPFLEVEDQRISMQIEMALATGDTALAGSLREMLSDSASYTPVMSPLAGSASVMVPPGRRIEPGDTLAVITGSPPDSTFIVIPPQGHLEWPEELDGTILSSGEILLDGPWPGDSVSLEGFYEIAPHFIHEEGLKTLLVTYGGDTLEVTVTGSLDGKRLVYSTIALDSLPLAGWE